MTLPSPSPPMTPDELSAALRASREYERRKVQSEYAHAQRLLERFDSRQQGRPQLSWVSRERASLEARAVTLRERLFEIDDLLGTAAEPND